MNPPHKLRKAAGCFGSPHGPRFCYSRGSTGSGCCPDKSGKTWRSYQACNSTVLAFPATVIAVRMQSWGRCRTHSVRLPANVGQRLMVH
jgi:hypothetical protein